MPENQEPQTLYNSENEPVRLNQSRSADTPGEYASLEKPIVAWHLGDVLMRETVAQREVVPVVQFLGGLSAEERRELDERIDGIAEQYDDRLADVLADLSDDVMTLLRRRAGATEPVGEMMVINSDLFASAASRETETCDPDLLASSRLAAAAISSGDDMTMEELTALLSEPPSTDRTLRYVTRWGCRPYRPFRHMKIEEISEHMRSHTRRCFNCGEQRTEYIGVCWGNASCETWVCAQCAPVLNEALQNAAAAA